jgi:hypothetical protein
MQTAIGYLRVSTQEQGRSGLGLAAQRFEIQAFGARAYIMWILICHHRRKSALKYSLSAFNSHLGGDGDSFWRIESLGKKNDGRVCSSELIPSFSPVKALRCSRASRVPLLAGWPFWPAYDGCAAM